MISHRHLLLKKDRCLFPVPDMKKLLPESEGYWRRQGIKRGMKLGNQAAACTS